MSYDGTIDELTEDIMTAQHARRATTQDEAGNCSQCRPSRDGAGNVKWINHCPDHDPFTREER